MAALISIHNQVAVYTNYRCLFIYLFICRCIWAEQNFQGSVYLTTMRAICIRLYNKPISDIINV